MADDSAEHQCGFGITDNTTGDEWRCPDAATVMTEEPTPGEWLCEHHYNVWLRLSSSC
jgi:hypothetical protein